MTPARIIGWSVATLAASAAAVAGATVLVVAKAAFDVLTLPH